MKSHILPRFLTNKNLDQMRRVEFGHDGKKPTIKQNSWVDDNLCILTGEQKLAAYDTAASNELQKHGLCWRYFPLTPHAKIDSITPAWSIITIPNVDSGTLRTFFLSLLWRAAASKMPQFKEIRLDMESARKLRAIVNGDVAASASDFPVVLTLLTTKGQPQNLTPLRQKMTIPQLAPGLPRERKIFRFFLDGLVVHVGRKSRDQKLLDSFGPRAVGSSEKLMLIGLTYEGSFQEANLHALQDELDRTWPMDASRVYESLATRNPVIAASGKP